MRIGNQPLSSAAILAGLVGQQIRATNFIADSGGLVGFAARTLLGAPVDATLRVSNNAGTIAASVAVDSNDILALRNGTTAQWLNIYNTYTDGLNYERARIQWAGNTFVIQTDAAGTGSTNRIMQIGAAGNIIRLDPNTGATTVLRSGGSAACLFEVSSNGSGLTSSALKFAKITPTIQQGGADAYTALDINVTETSVGSGAKRLIDGRVGGSTVFAVANTGDVTMRQLLLQSGSGLIAFSERTDPAAPPANNGYLYMRDNGSGKTQLVMLFPSGAVQVIATEP